ncbi:alginate lyase family protein [Litchfieldella rifensis]|uniref:Alginate lyase family protein n=1 Tax=Litchfieldella rifensis TaxID=762643 RepID=A0ABV7LTC4_9GAMM
MTSLLSKVKPLVAAFPGAVWLYRCARNNIGSKKVRVPYSRAIDRGKISSNGRKEDGAIYKKESVDSVDFVLYRIVGNDLTPRHRKGQSLDNLKFILENEPVLIGCEKRFIVNRIVDKDEESKIISLLESSGVPYLHIPFNKDKYIEQGWDIEGVPIQYAPYSEQFSLLDESQKGRVLARLYRFKNNYIINNNGARNASLADGRDRASWILPWDGNCFLTAEGWDELRHAIVAQPELPYWVVPMARVTDNAKLLEPGFRPVAEEEPQMVFRADTQLMFDPEYFYGRRPKVELFWRLGVPGQWDTWSIEPWDLPCPEFAEEAGQFGRAGWVARLFSGQAELEVEQGTQALVGRGLARVEAITELCDRIDDESMASAVNPAAPVFTDLEALKNTGSTLLDHLKQAADAALQRGPYSVVDKKTLPPSRNPHDYWHPAPYFWPNPLRLPGLPYVRRDGKRIPGTRLYEPLSDNYDRTRLQRLFDDTYMLALAAVRFGQPQYGAHAARLVRTWFLQPETAMTPHLEYAQVRRGHDRNRGSSSGVIEMKDLYYFLDAVRLLVAHRFLDEDEDATFREWLKQYLNWLLSSRQGQQERTSANNHGTYYDLQVASIAAYLEEYRLLRHTLRDSRFRIIEQFEPDGRQPHEMLRTTTAHYCCFNLQGWVHLAQLASHVGEDLWGFQGPEGQCLRMGMEWLLGHSSSEWPYRQIDDFDSERFYPLVYAYRAHFESAYLCHGSVTAETIKPLFHPHDGIRPFWQLGTDT